MILYVGDARDVIKRILTNHCNGNVEASALRRHVAEAMGYKLRSTRRTSGSLSVRIDLPDYRTGEAQVSNYIRSGLWRYVICSSCEEAHDFQWFAIDRLKPILNRNREAVGYEREERYQSLLAQLTQSPALKFSQLRGTPSGPGVYVFEHEHMPPRAYDAR